MPETVPDPIDDAFRAVEADWDADDAHRKFIALATALERLPEAGRRYRNVCENDPARAEVARRRIDQIQLVAWQRVQSLKADVDLRSYRRGVFLWIALGILIVVVGIALNGIAGLGW